MRLVGCVLLLASCRGLTALLHTSSSKYYASHISKALQAVNSESIDDDNSTLAQLVSSPERYVAALGLSSIDEVRAIQQKREQDVIKLQKQMHSSTLTGKQKHALLCAHRYRHGKHPFVCRSCWSYQPICICGDGDSGAHKIKLPFSVGKLVLWTHHDEWGSVSNTGSVLGVALHGTQILMKGHVPHDERLQHELLDGDSIQPIILWTNETKHINDDDSKSPTVYSIQQLKERIGNNNNNANKTVVLIAIEGSWRNARRMVSKLDHDIPRLAIQSHDMFWRNEQQRDGPASQSILSPLKQQKGGSRDNLCTAEAIIAALVGFGMDQTDGMYLLRLVTRKVDRTRQYRGKVTRN